MEQAPLAIENKTEAEAAETPLPFELEDGGEAVRSTTLPFEAGGEDAAPLPFEVLPVEVGGEDAAPLPFEVGGEGEGDGDVTQEQAGGGGPSA